MSDVGSDWSLLHHSAFFRPTGRGRRHSIKKLFSSSFLNHVLFSQLSYARVSRFNNNLTHFSQKSRRGSVSITPFLSPHPPGGTGHGFLYSVHWRKQLGWRRPFSKLILLHIDVFFFQHFPRSPARTPPPG